MAVGVRSLLAKGLAVIALTLPFGVTCTPAHADGAMSCTDPLTMVFDTTIEPNSQSVQFTLDGGSSPVTVDWGGQGTATPAGAVGSADIPTTARTYPASPGAVGFTYATPGTYTVRVCGPVRHFGSTFQVALRKVTSFGSLGITDLSSAFRLARNLTSVPAALPPGVTNLAYTFYGTNSFNQPISGWDTSHVTSLAFTFAGALSFNQALDGWDTSHVTDLSATFASSAYNQPLASWDTRHVTTLAGTFSSDKTFNQPLATWNTSHVTDMSDTFNDAEQFNQPIGGWDTSQVTSLARTFYYAPQFDQPIGTWNTGRVTTMSGLFEDAAHFNQPVGGWDTSRVTNMNATFGGATAFNQPLNEWKTGNVTTMRYTFSGALSFNQSLGTWDVTRVTDLTDFLDGGMVNAAYCATLQGWATQAVQPNVTFEAPPNYYPATAATARASLINSHHWSIRDAGPAIVAFPDPVIWATNATIGIPITAQVPSPSLPTGITYHYQWYRNWKTPIVGATAATYTPTLADLGQTLMVRVTGSATTFAPITRSSNATSRAVGVLTTNPPVIVGTPRVGSTLTVTPNWKPAGIAYTYQWYRNGTAIRGARSAKYLVASIDRRSKVTVRVTAQRTNFLSAWRTSAPVTIA